MLRGSVLKFTTLLLLTSSAPVVVQSFSVAPQRHAGASAVSSSSRLVRQSLTRLYDIEDVDATDDVNINGMTKDNDEEIEETEENDDMESIEANAGDASEDKETASKAVPSSTSSYSSSASKKNLQFLQTLGAITGRGEFASDAQKQAARQVVEALEQQPQDTVTSERLQGTWELVYCSTQLFRSSPFFMAGRAVCQTDDAAQQYNWFCDMHRKALAISTIRAVRQVISDTRLVSEFEVSAGAVPFLRDLTPFAYSGGLPLTIDGALVSSADYQILDDGDDSNTTTGTMALELYMDTVEIKGSNVPGLRQLLDQDAVKLESRRLSKLLEQNVPGYAAPKPIFRITYMTSDGMFRICRDQDDNIFVYCKTSDVTTPTAFKWVDADLGVARLLEGFNDAVSKIYL
eukprot:scaffold38939_cov191-Amphora_coffeaeformis.AAC.2